jgi:hypothetical protein
LQSRHIHVLVEAQIADIGQIREIRQQLDLFVLGDDLAQRIM